MTLSIRRAIEKDIPQILALLVQVDMVHHTGRPDIFKGPTTKYSAEDLATMIDNDSAPIFVCADEDNRVLGHAFCVHRKVIGDRVLTDIRTLYIDDICVDEAHRGQGVGKMLCRHVIAYAKEQGFYNITLNVWSCNEGAMRFYEAMGLVPQKIGMEMIL